MSDQLNSREFTDSNGTSGESKTCRESEFVISGISGRFPESDSVGEFENNLFGGVDMITADDRRWPQGWKGLPERSGKLKSLSKFDASMFSISPKQVNSMDPQQRILLEVVYEAMLDAGVDPVTMRGSRTGVFLAISATESESAMLDDSDNVSGYVLTGCQRSMVANRISYVFDFRGPSFPVDTACSSSLLALELAHNALRQGHCDSAIVAGSHLCTNPMVALCFANLNMTNTDGKCKSFDANGDGYARAETIAAMLIQKSTNAKRAYATIVHSKSSTDGYKQAGVTVPSGDRQLNLLQEVYTECKVDPCKVSYVEAHGTGTKVGDPQEAYAITEMFCPPHRDSELLIGSVKSNMGHAETASAMCSIIKVLISMERQLLPGNLHYNEPNPYIPGLLDGRLKVGNCQVFAAYNKLQMLQVVSENTEWTGEYAAINSFGFGGANTHVLLRTTDQHKERSKEKPQNDLSDVLLRLHCASGRTEEGVRALLQAAEHNKNNVSYLALQSHICNQNPTQALYRGYTLLHSAKDSQMHIKKTPSGSMNSWDAESDIERPIWFVYSGMGSQWPGMAKQLMHLPDFARSMYENAEALKIYGVDLMTIVDSTDNEEASVLESTVNCMICITAIQIALTDLLAKMNVTPTGIFGHSIGEIACGYADGGLTRAQAMRLAHARGTSIMHGNLTGTGCMAAVGLSLQETERRVPSGVYAACHNAVDSVTISGDTESVQEFVKDLTGEGIFAKVVNSSGVPFHSPRMLTVKDDMLKKFNAIIPEPNRRTSRWISTSVSQTDDLKTATQSEYCSADYHVNNTVSKVNFYGALQNIPEDSVVIELGPSALLASIIRRSVPQSCTFIGLLKRNAPEELEFLLGSIGRLYQSGIHVDVAAMHSQASFPVPRGTPQISPLIQWDHDVDWFVQDFGKYAQNGIFEKRTAACSKQYLVEPFKENSPDAYLKDHVIDGRMLYPFTGYITLAWSTLASLSGLCYLDTGFQLTDFIVKRATLLSDKMSFGVFINPSANGFTITESDSIVCTGNMQLIKANELSTTMEEQDEQEGTETTRDSEYTVDSADVYKELLLRGYEYGPEFRGIDQIHGTSGRLRWSGKWVPFLDSCIQTWLMADGQSSLSLPTGLRYLRVNPAEHHNKIITQEITEESKEPQQFVNFSANLYTNECIVGGVELRGLKALSTSRQARTNGTLVLEHVQFVPYHNNNHLANNPEMRQQLTRYKNIVTQKMIRALNREQNGFGALLSGVRKNLLENEQHMACKMTMQPEEIEKSHSNQSLLECVESLFTSEFNSESMTDHVRGQQSTLCRDMLYGASIELNTIKRTIDLVIQNTPGYHFKWAVCSSAGSLIHETLSQIVDLQPKLSVDCHCLLPDNDKSESDDSKVNSDGTKTNEKCPRLTDATHLIGHCDLIVLNRVLSQEKDIEMCLRNALALVTESGFVAVVEVTSDFEINAVVDTIRRGASVEQPSTDPRRVYGSYMKHEQWLETFDKLNVKTVSVVTDPVFCTTTFLVRREQSHTNEIIDVDDVQNFEWLEAAVKKSNNETNEASTIQWLTSTKLPDNGLIGLSLSLRDETSKQNSYRMMFDINMTDQRSTLGTLSSIPREIAANDLHINCLRDSKWGCFCHDVIAPERAIKLCENAFINVKVKGDLSSTTWIETEEPNIMKEHNNNPHEQLVTVYYAPLNFRDIMLATGRLAVEAIPSTSHRMDREKLIGLEFVGRLPNGRRVMGITGGAALATNIVIDERSCIDVPETWTMEEAATVPVAYATAFYALLVRGNLQRGDRVLIHSGSGAVGQAAIHMALSYDCEVFTTVGTVAKRQFVKERFPTIDDGHISNSRSATFERDIMNRTRGKGVNIVLNSLAGDMLQASVRCLAEFGRFLEIGKFDLSRNTGLGMEIFLKSITFHGVLLDSHNTGGHNEVLEGFKSFLSDNIKSGRMIRPLTRTVFPVEKIADAFRYMSTGDHVGKVVVQIRDEETSVLALPRPIQVYAEGRTFCHPEHNYIITGGLGGFGLELANFLVERNAKHVVLTSRSGIKTGYQRRRIAAWRESGVEVIIDQSDISTMSGANQLLIESIANRPIGGIFHLAMVLRDALFENQTSDNFKEVAKMKYWGTKHLDNCTRAMCDNQLKWFVVFSSVTAARGNAGQTAYAWGNSAMERIVEKRRHDGYAGMAIQWGAIGDVGVVMDNFGSNDAVVSGTSPQRMKSCIECLDIFLTLNHTIVSSFVRTSTAKKESAKHDDVLKAIAEILGVNDVSKLNLNTKLNDFGVDSLIGVELRQLFERDYNTVLTMKDIRTMTINDLKQMAEGTSKSKVVSDKPKSVTTPRLEAAPSDSMNLFRLRLDDIRKIVWQDIVPLNEKQPKTKNPLVFCHAIEGVSAPLRKLGAHVDDHAICVQCTSRAPLESLEEMCSYYADVVCESQPDGCIRLVGYSYGACVAFEMSCQLRERERQVQLLLIDGSPAYWELYKVAYRAGHDVAANDQQVLSSEMFENELAVQFAQRFGVDDDLLKRELSEQSDWNGRLGVTCTRIAEMGAFADAESVRWPLHSFRQRFTIADRYKPTKNFDGDCVLIRAANSVPDNIGLDKDYGVKNVVNGEVTVYTIEDSTHDQLIEGDRQCAQIATIINKCMQSPY